MKPLADKGKVFQIKDVKIADIVVLPKEINKGEKTNEKRRKKVVLHTSV